MKEHPILFKGEMVRAILEGRKTQTRRTSPRWDRVKKGDLLWVRETFLGGPQEQDICYRAACPCELSDEIHRMHVGWTPSILMPRWASRLTLRATADVRVERVQNITNGAARAEGVGTCDCRACQLYGYREQFSKLWDKMYGPGAWARNDLVRVISFEVAS
jgi:hypothetical protein